MLLTLALAFTMTISALAAPGGGGKDDDKGGGNNSNDVKVDGSVGKGVYKVSYDKQVSWYITDDSNLKVWNNSKNNDDPTPNKIRNNSNGTAYVVTLKSINLKNEDAKKVAEKLKLYLTGDLVLSSNMNISKGYTGTKAYTKQLTPGKDWKYGFSGEYTAWLTGTSYAPTYSMTLNFDMGK